MKKPYKYIEHTADLGIEVSGLSFEVLLINIGKAIFETQIKGIIKSDNDVTLHVKSDTRDDLFIDWCRELLYLFSVDHFIPKEYTIDLADLSLNADLKGDIFDPQRHKVRIEIKNPTYHNFKIERTDESYRATIIFDV
jgi:SHS2 domain-containing protein